MFSIFTKLKNNFYNLWEKIFLKLSKDELEFISSISLFQDLNKDEMETLIKGIRRKRYTANEIILKEGCHADAFYIIVSGSVRIFSYDLGDKKIILGTLDQGQYFGEQAFVTVNKCRNASIEAITDTILLEIDEKYLTQILHPNTALVDSLTKIGERQLLYKISKFASAYEHLEKYLVHHYSNVIQFNKDDVIFSVDQEPDYVYIILEGFVKVTLKEKAISRSLLLGKGHIFGEISVLNNSGRKGTAIASEFTRVIRIYKNDFIKYYNEHPKLKKLINTLSRIYSIPNRGSIVQTLGSLNNEEIVSATYKLQSGRIVIATSSQQLFVMEELHQVGKVHTFSNENIAVKIFVKDAYIVKVECIGIWHDLSAVCAYILDQSVINDTLIKLFTKKGIFKPIEYQNSDTICKCLQVAKKDILDLLEQGYSYTQVAEKTGCGSVCGACKPDISNLIGSSSKEKL